MAEEGRGDRPRRNWRWLRLDSGKAQAIDADPSARLYPFKLDETYKLDGKQITPEAINGNYNNFYEFGQSKRIASPRRR